MSGKTGNNAVHASDIENTFLSHTSHVQTLSIGGSLVSATQIAKVSTLVTAIRDWPFPTRNRLTIPNEVKWLLRIGRGL